MNKGNTTEISASGYRELLCAIKLHEYKHISGSIGLFCKYCGKLDAGDSVQSYIATNIKDQDVDWGKAITKWLSPKIKSQSQYGIVNNYDWIREEKQRIEIETGRECIIFKNGSNQEVLFYA